MVSELFLDAGLKPDARGVNGETSLFYAVRGQRIEVVKLLPAKGADVNAKDKFGGTPLMLAAEIGSLELPQSALYIGTKRSCRPPLSRVTFAMMCLATWCEPMSPAAR